MHDQRKLAKNYAKARVKILFELMDDGREDATRWALEVAEFFQGNNGVGRTARVNFLALVRGRGIRLRQEPWPICPIEKGPAPHGEERDDRNN
jgi:hypothetical protein